MKKCTKCGEVKDLPAFSVSTRNKSGYQAQCKACKNSYNKNPAKKLGDARWRERNADKVREQALAAYYRKRELRLQAMKDYYYRDLKANRARACLWSKENPEKRNAYARIYRKLRPDIAAHRSMLKGVIRRLGITKNATTLSILGYTPMQLKEHIEQQFLPGMSWERRSEWHIDHRRSVASFLAEGITDPTVINALDNLQPLWAADNISKGSR